MRAAKMHVWLLAFCLLRRRSFQAPAACAPAALLRRCAAALVCRCAAATQCCCVPALLRVRATVLLYRCACMPLRRCFSARLRGCSRAFCGGSLAIAVVVVETSKPSSAGFAIADWMRHGGACHPVPPASAIALARRCEPSARRHRQRTGTVGAPAPSAHRRRTSIVGALSRHRPGTRRRTGNPKSGFRTRPGRRCRNGFAVDHRCRAAG